MVGEGRVRLEVLRTGMQALAPFQYRLLGQADFARRLRAGLPLQHPAHNQDDMLRHELAAREDRATVEVIDPLAAATAVDRQPTAGIDAEQARVLAGRGAVGAAPPSGMKLLLQPRDTLVIIEEVNDWQSMPLIVPTLHYLYS